MGEDIAGQGNPGSPGSDGASPYQALALTFPWEPSPNRARSRARSFNGCPGKRRAATSARISGGGQISVDQDAGKQDQPDKMRNLYGKVIRDPFAYQADYSPFVNLFS